MCRKVQAITRRMNMPTTETCLPLWGRWLAVRRDGEGPLSQKSKIFASSPRGRAKLRRVSLHCGKKAATGIHPRWPLLFAVNGRGAVAFFFVVLVVASLLDITAYKNNSQNNRQINYFYGEFRPAIMVKNHSLLLSIRPMAYIFSKAKSLWLPTKAHRSNDTEQGKAVTMTDAPAHALSAATGRRYRAGQGSSDS